MLHHSSKINYFFFRNFLFHKYCDIHSVFVSFYLIEFVCFLPPQVYRVHCTRRGRTKSERGRARRDFSRRLSTMSEPDSQPPTPNARTGSCWPAEDPFEVTAIQDNSPQPLAANPPGTVDASGCILAIQHIHYIRIHSGTGTMWSPGPPPRVALPGASGGAQAAYVEALCGRAEALFAAGEPRRALRK